MLTNTDATLYHRSYNPATRLDEWESTYIPALWWYEAEQSSVTTEDRGHFHGPHPGYHSPGKKG